jgi:polyphosphate:AMP phosphotransferase
MLEHIDLDRRVTKKEFKAAEEDWEIRLGQLQRSARKANVPIIVVFEGWDAAGKGTLINNLILPLDPRGLKVYSTLEPTEEESLRPFLWRPWIRSPQRGRIAIFDRSWYRQLLTERVEGDTKPGELAAAVEDIRAFERQLADDGAVIVKLFLHISKKEQKKRFDKLRKHKTTAWRVTDEDLRRHKKYDEYLDAANEMLTDTDAEHAPWTIIEARDERFATLKIFNTVALAIERRLAELDDKPASDAAPPAAEKVAMPEQLRSNILEGVDLDQTLGKGEYKDHLNAAQKKLRKLEHRIYMERVGVVIVYEGWDAAGKGGNIRRLTRELDPRGYEVVPVAAPNDIEQAHHYLWRFWTQIPKAGHITIFDRSWYGRVLVERVEGFCSEHQWRRAYREINEMERHLTNFGHLLLKFWLHISPEEQLRRFEARRETEHKQWKITDEDWRNRARWDQYEAAVEEMLFRTSTPDAPWTIIESDCKRFARVKTIETVCDVIKTALKRS